MSTPSRARPRALEPSLWPTAARSVLPRSRARSSMSDTGSKNKNPQEAARADAKAAKASKRKEVNTGTQVAVGEHAREEGYVPRFKKRYHDTIKPALMEKFGYKN